MYYIANGLNAKWLAYIFAIFAAIAAFGIGNMVQSNSVAASLEVTFGGSQASHRDCIGNTSCSCYVWWFEKDCHGN